MKTKIKVVRICFLLIIAWMFVYTQQKQKSTSFDKKVALDSLLNKKFESLGITESKLLKLKQIGINLRDIAHQKLEIDDERIDAVTQDLVIIGKVLNIVDFPGTTLMPYHSKVNVLIIEVLKGAKPQHDTIQLVRENGPITDGSLKGSQLIVTNTTNFSIGETSVFFLTNVFTDPYFNSRYKSFFINHSTELPNPSYYVRPNHKHEVIGSMVQYHKRSIPLEKFKSNVKKINKLLSE